VNLKFEENKNRKEELREVALVNFISWLIKVVKIVVTTIIVVKFNSILRSNLNISLDASLVM